MEQVIRNEWGEPIGTEYIPSAYEQEIMECEEMDRRANDYAYACRLENERWYNEAVAVFEERGIEVPWVVVDALAEEMRKKARKAAEDAAMKDMQPYVDWLVARGYKARARYEPETPMEVAISYIEVRHQDESRLTREEFYALVDEYDNDESSYKSENYCFEEYVSY